MSRLEVPTRTKGPPFIPVGGFTRDKRPNHFIPVGNTNPDKRMTLLSRLVAPTRTKGPFCPGWWLRDKRLRGPFVPVGATNRDKRPPFCPGWCLQPGQKAPVPPLARLAVGPGTKATYYPGPKDCQDKWPGTKAYFVVVTTALHWSKRSCTGSLELRQN